VTRPTGHGHLRCVGPGMGIETWLDLLLITLSLIRPVDQAGLVFAMAALVGPFACLLGHHQPLLNYSVYFSFLADY
jgi:hypothetical protein